MWKIFHLACIILIGFSRSNAIPNQSDNGGKPNSYGKCRLHGIQNTFSVLPGRGWDNLQNVERGQVIDTDFSKCLMSSDNKYLIPAHMSLIPLKTSTVELYSKLITHFKDYKSNTALSINVALSGSNDKFSISGSYSQDYQRVKEFQLKTKSDISTVNLRYRFYKIISEPSAKLAPAFKQRILDMNSLLCQKRPNEVYVMYLADLIVRDYGTHVTRSIDAGAILSKIDALNKQYVKKHKGKKNDISAAAAASFMGKFKAKIDAKVGYKYSKDNSSEFETNTEMTHIETIGGDMFKTGFSLDEWESSVLNNLVAVDRDGEPIYHVINRGSLPELSVKELQKIFRYVKDAVDRYVKKNTIEGCMDINDINFDVDSNVDNGECHLVKHSYNFGGVYQKCIHESFGQKSCDGLNINNPITGKLSCPKGFAPAPLLKNFKLNCNTKSGIFSSKYLCASIDLYWCTPTKTNFGSIEGYQYGGFTDQKKPNCQVAFFPIKFGQTKSICVSKDKKERSLSKYFGGIFSCQSGNPLATMNESKNNTKVPMETSRWSKSCPLGYHSKIITLENSCELSVCEAADSDVPVKSAHMPPFIESAFIRLDQSIELEMQTGFNMKDYMLIGVCLGFTLFVLIFLVIIIMLCYRGAYWKKLTRFHQNINSYQSLNKQNISMSPTDNTSLTSGANMSYGTPQ